MAGNPVSKNCISENSHIWESPAGWYTSQLHSSWIARILLWLATCVPSFLLKEVWALPSKLMKLYCPNNISVLFHRWTYGVWV